MTSWALEDRRGMDFPVTSFPKSYGYFSRQCPYNLLWG